jgi:hypothetical protein
VSAFKYTLGHKSLGRPCFRWSSTCRAFDAQRTCALFIHDIVILFSTYSMMKPHIADAVITCQIEPLPVIIALVPDFSLILSFLPFLLCTLTFSGVAYLVLVFPVDRVPWSECRLICQVVNFVSLVVFFKVLLFL